MVESCMLKCISVCSQRLLVINGEQAFVLGIRLSIILGVFPLRSVQLVLIWNARYTWRFS